MNSGGIWTQQAKLTATDGQNGDEFGRAVAISGSTVIVGAPSKASFAGAAYVYVNSGGVWTQQAKLTAADGDAGDRLGWSVALAGPTAILGTPNKDAITGAAYVFVNSGGTWTQQAKLAAADGAAGDYFGWAVGTSGSVAVVGAPNRNALTGEVYVFVRSGDTWSQNAEFTATDAVPGDYFGWSAAIAGATVVAGSPLKYSETGVAYVFAHSGSIWRQQAKLTASDGDANDWFASSVAVSRSTVVVGAYYK